MGRSSRRPGTVLPSLLQHQRGGAVLSTTAGRMEPDKKEAAQLRRPYCNFGGCSSPSIKACISDNRIGSTPSHWTHWNLRPPVFKAMKCIGLRHFGQVGVGRVSAMTTHAGLRRESYRTHCRLESVPFDCLYGPRLVWRTCVVMAALCKATCGSITWREPECQKTALSS